MSTGKVVTGGKAEAQHGTFQQGWKHLEDSALPRLQGLELRRESSL